MGLDWVILVFMLRGSQGSDDQMFKIYVQDKISCEFGARRINSEVFQGTWGIRKALCISTKSIPQKVEK